MFDTVALKHVLLRPPSPEKLRELGWKSRFHTMSGECRRWVHNAPRNTKAPRLTISQSPDQIWHLRAEASIPAWMHGSNTTLPDEYDVEKYFSRLSTYVRRHSGFKFSAKDAKVVRLDATRDLNLGLSNVIPTIFSLMHFQIPKYRRRIYDDKSIEYVNKGSMRTKTIKIYSKSSDVIEKDGTTEELKRAEGILRIEVSYTANNSIERLQREHNLEDKRASGLLVKSVSDAILEKIVGQLNLVETSGSVDNLDKLFATYSANKAIRLAGFILAIERFGEDFYKNSQLSFNRRTYYEHLAQCKKAGVVIN